MREAIYKGATRPPMKWGVPLVALVGLFMPAIVALFWAMFLANRRFGGSVGTSIMVIGIAVLVTLFMWMRQVTARDDQRLNQTIKAWKLRLANRNRALFGFRSYGAYRAVGARDGWRR